MAAEAGVRGGGFEDLLLPLLKMEEVAMTQGRQAASKDWKSGKASLVGTQPC